MSDTHRHYLLDLGTLLRDHGLAAAKDKREAAAGEDAAFHAGRAFAYYEVLSLMADQARAFGLPPADLGLEGLDPDAALLK